MKKFFFVTNSQVFKRRRFCKKPEWQKINYIQASKIEIAIESGVFLQKKCHQSDHFLVAHNSICFSVTNSPIWPENQVLCTC